MNLQTSFQKLNQTGKAGNPMAGFRQQNFELFSQQGLPTKADEAWHYTSLKHLPESILEPEQETLKLSRKELEGLLSTELNPAFNNIVLVNGILNEDLSDLKSLKPLQVSFVEDYFASSLYKSMDQARNQIGKIRTDSMEALNLAFTNQVLLLELPADTSLSKPLHLIHYSSSEKSVYSKSFIRLAPGSKLSLIETYVSDSKKSLTNSGCDVFLENSSTLEYIRVQSEAAQVIHLGRSRFFLEKQATLDALSYATGALLSRHNLEVYCLGEQASATVNGLTLGAAHQHFDNHTLIDHVVGSCNTNQLYKSILDGESRAVFNGRVLIRPKAQKAASQQLNNNLLLSSKAEADSKPELGIYADDVKATHGSTVGQLDAEELFYFLSRAIPREKAVEMLSLGFVKELIDRVSNPSIQAWLQIRLLKAYQKMKGSL